MGGWGCSDRRKSSRGWWRAVAAASAHHRYEAEERLPRPLQCEVTAGSETHALVDHAQSGHARECGGNSLLSRRSRADTIWEELRSLRGDDDSRDRKETRESSGRAFRQSTGSADGVYWDGTAGSSPEAMAKTGRAQAQMHLALQLEMLLVGCLDVSEAACRFVPLASACMPHTTVHVRSMY